MGGAMRVIYLHQPEMLDLLVAGRTPTSLQQPNVYRAFSADGRLLYVGVSNDLRKRFMVHQSWSAWFNETSTYRVETYEDRHTALRVERRAINTEAPVYNRTAPAQPRYMPPRPVAPELRVLITDLLGEDPVAYCQRRRKEGWMMPITYRALAAELQRSFADLSPKTSLGDALRLWVQVAEDDWLPTNAPERTSPP